MAFNGGSGEGGDGERAREAKSCTSAAAPPPAAKCEEGAGPADEAPADDSAANALINLVAFPRTNPTLSKSSLLISPMISSSISCAATA